MKKKLGALLLVFTMVLSLFSGLGVNTVWADDNEGGDTGNTITGLAAKDWFDWDDDGHVTTPNAEAEWSNELEATVDGKILLVQKLENGVATGEAIKADALTLAYCGDGEQPGDSLETDNVGSVTAVDYNDEYVQLKFAKTGWYKLYQSDASDDVIIIKVGYKELGFYTTETKTPEGVVESATPYTFTTQESNVIYLITNVPNDVTWDGSLEWKVDVHGNDIEESQQARYFEKTLISGADNKNQIYKITLKKGSFEWMFINVKATGTRTTGDDGTEEWNPEEGITIHYVGNAVGFCATQEFDWDDEAGCPVVSNNATYRKEGWADFSHSAPYQFAKVDESGNVTAYKKDDLVIEPMNGASGAHLLQDGNVIRIKFDGPGSYKVYAASDSTDYVTISADFNSVGLYTSQNVSMDTVCDSESTLWRDECNELYVLPYGIGENVTPTYEFSVIPADSDQKVASDGYYTTEKLSNGTYKIVINKDNDENFTVLVTMEWQNENGETEMAEASVWSQNRDQEVDKTGFVAIADIDRQDPQVPNDADWYRYIGAYYTDEACIVFADRDKDGNITYVTADQLSLTDENGNAVGSIKANAKDSNFCDLEFPGIGNYKVVKKSDSKEIVYLDVYYREVAFYKNQTVSKDSYLSSLVTASDNEAFYMLENTNDAVNAVEFRGGIEKDGNITYFTDNAKYFTCEKVNTGIYKITLAKKADLPVDFFIEVKASLQNMNETYDADGLVWIHTDKSSSGGSSSGGSSSGGSSSGGSTSGGTSDSPKPTPTPEPGQTTTETKTETTTNSKGNTVKQETTTIKNSDGTVASTTVKSEIENVAKNTSASVSVTKDADGKIASAEASVENTVNPGKSDKAKTTISASVVKQMTDAAGTKNLTITQTVKDTKGNVLYTVETNAADLKAGKKLTLVKIEDGKQILVSKPVTVSKSGNVSVNAEKGEYQLLNASEAKALQKEILKTVVPKKSTVAVEPGKKSSVELSSKLDMDNVAKISYSSSNKSVVKVDKNGKITAQKRGNATITITVTLNDGTVKKVKVKVKAKK